MALEAHLAPPPVVEFTKGSSREPTKEFAGIFKRMRGAIAEVFPDKSDAWNYETNFGEEGRTTPPPKDVKEWLAHFPKMHPFAQQLAQRYVTLWRTLEERGMSANGKELFPHQQALFSWLTIGGLAASTRDELPSVLMRSPFGSGKSLVGGLAVEGYQDLLLDEMLKGEVGKHTPHGMIVGFRRDITIQNATGGEAFAAQRPPYHFDRVRARELYEKLRLTYGANFTSFFPEPKGSERTWYDLCGCVNSDEDHEKELPPINTRILRYLNMRANDFLRQPGGPDLLALMERLMGGRAVLLTDASGKPHEIATPKRLGDLEPGKFTGDMAYALHPAIGIRATHRDLLPDPRLYNTDPDAEQEYLFGVFAGSSITRRADSVRADIKKMLRSTNFMLVDEAGRLNPDQLRHNLPRNHPALVIGLAATNDRDESHEDWVRSPRMSVKQSVEMRITKPVGFAFIGKKDQTLEQGSDAAWEQYVQELFKDDPLLKKLGLPQSYMVDGLVVVPAKHVRLFGDRLQKAYDAKGIKAQVYAYDAAAGMSRWNTLEHTLRGLASDEPRKIVAPPALASVGYSLGIDSIDTLAKLSPENLYQLLGRLYHRRNMKRTPGARTYFRQQIFGAPQHLILRRIAEEMGFDLPESDAEWVQFQCGVDFSAKEEDDRRRGMPKPTPIPDLRRKKGPRTPGEKKAAGPVKLPLRTNELQGTAPSQTNGKPIDIVLAFDPNGMLNEESAKRVTEKYRIGAWWGPLWSRCGDAYKQGKRGQDLANFCAEKIAFYQTKVTAIKVHPDDE